MKNANWTTFRVVLWSILFISLLIHALAIAYRWWDFDPRLSCRHLTRWDDWISCMHGPSHLYVFYFELAVGIWFAAGTAAVLARMLGPYISAIVPGGVVAIWLWARIHYWNEHVAPYSIIHYRFGIPDPGIIFYFAAWTGFLAAYIVAPVGAAWLLGLHARTQYRLGRARVKLDAQAADVF